MAEYPKAIEMKHDADRATGKGARGCVDQVSHLPQVVKQSVALQAEIYTSKLLSEPARDEICEIMRQEHRSYMCCGSS